MGGKVAYGFTGRVVLTADAGSSRDGMASNSN